MLVSAPPSMDQDESPAVIASRMIVGHWLAQAIQVACELKIPDLLGEGAASSEELASATDADPAAMHRLLRALASQGVVRHLEDGRFERTDLSDVFRRDVPGTLGPYARYITGPDVYRAWGDLLHSIRTGEIAAEHTFEMRFFEYYDRHPEAGRIFNEAMSSSARWVADDITTAYDFSDFGTVVDVAGGQGILLAAILRRNPAGMGVLFDLPHVIEQARSVLEAEGVAERCRLVAGSFFDGVPSGGDAYVLKSIIHDWDDERSLDILSNCRRAMGTSGRLLVIDRVISERIEPTLADQRATLMDLNMLVLTGGRERTLPEFEQLFERAGFKLQRSVPTSTGLHVIEGLPG